jgi:endoglycosylceramidase
METILSRVSRFAFVVACLTIVAAPLSVFTSPSAAAQTTLPRVFIHDGRFVDETGRAVQLRGVVTVTHSKLNSPLYYSSADYRRMRAMGVNYQAVRLHGVLIGVGPNSVVSPDYLANLDSMVAMAQEAGIYTQFKLTLYDFSSTWDALWQNKNGEQDAIIAGWNNIWQRYKGNPTVIGYDLLNEPEQGTLGLDNKTFVEQYVNPFYQKAIDALHQVDPDKLAYIQPPFKVLSYDEVPIERDGVVYAPHFFAGIWGYVVTSSSSTQGYEQLMNRFILDAAAHSAPLFIGEYGMPWNPTWGNDPARIADHQMLERAASDLFDQHKVGFSRPYYADDNTARNVNAHTLSWALFAGENGVSGEERRFITDVFVRPYPQAMAGTLLSHAFNHDSRAYTLTYASGLVGRNSEIFIPQARVYPTGFTATFNDGTTVTYSPGGISDVAFVANPQNHDASIFGWDGARQVLTIQNWATGALVNVTITDGAQPLSEVSPPGRRLPPGWWRTATQ